MARQLRLPLTLKARVETLENRLDEQDERLVKFCAYQFNQDSLSKLAKRRILSKVMLRKIAKEKLLDDRWAEF